MRNRKLHRELQPEVASTRDRFLAALEAGMSVAEATRLANALCRAPVTLPPPPQKLVDGAALSQLDHDGDGKPGGSTAPEQTDDLAALRAEYKDRFGKKPFAGWGADVLREKIAAANA